MNHLSINKHIHVFIIHLFHIKSLFCWQGCKNVWRNLEQSKILPGQYTVSVHYWSLQVTWEMSDIRSQVNITLWWCMSVSVFNISLERTFSSTRSHQGHNIFLTSTQLYRKSAIMCAPVFHPNLIYASIISRKWHYLSSWFFITNSHRWPYKLQKKRKIRWETFFSPHILNIRGI